MSRLCPARFVILRHDSPGGLHWDLMLEADGVLRTWALDAEPIGRLMSSADQLPDHRLAYLDYEGEISEGRGAVARFDSGEYRLQRDDAQGLVVELRGARLRGSVTLVHEGDGQRWRFSFEPVGTAASGFSEGSDVGEPSDSRPTV